MQRKRIYNKKFVTWIESICQESGDVQPVDHQFYESFVSFTDKELEVIVRGILQQTATYINKKLFSGEWDTDDDLYQFVMLFLELIAEGKTAFHMDTGKMVFLKPVGELPSADMWGRIQERISSSRPTIQRAIVKNVLSRRGV